jgi:hypothetical protein
MEIHRNSPQPEAGLIYPFFGCDLIWKPQSVGHPAALWW